MTMGKTQHFGIFLFSFSDRSVREFFSTSGWIGRSVWESDGSALLTVMEEASSKSGQLWRISFPDAQARRITNGLTHYIGLSDLARDGRTAVSVTAKFSANLWSVDPASLSPARQLSDGPAVWDFQEPDDGRLFVLTEDEELWTAEPDGSHRELLSNVHANGFVRCGNATILRVHRDGQVYFVRLGDDGTHPTDMVAGRVLSPVCSSNSREMYYVDLTPPQRVMSVGLDGGTPEEVFRVPGDGFFARLTISNDGRYLAVPFEEYHPSPILRVAIIDTAGAPKPGVPGRTLVLPAEVYKTGVIEWSPNASAVQFLLNQNGSTNIWEQPLEGGPPRQVSHFTVGEIANFHWSADGKRLYITENNSRSDAVMIRNLP